MWAPVISLCGFLAVIALLQSFYNCHKSLKRICPRIIWLFCLEHHIILVLLPGQLRPLISDFGLLLGFIIIQVVALGFHHQYFSAVEHHDDVRVSMGRPVNLEAQLGDIPMPPLDVALL